MLKLFFLTFLIFTFSASTITLTYAKTKTATQKSCEKKIKKGGTWEYDAQTDQCRFKRSVYK